MPLSDICFAAGGNYGIRVINSALNIAAQQTLNSQANNPSYHLQLLSALFNKTDRRKRALSNKVLFSRYSKYHHGINLKWWLKECYALTSYRYSTFAGLLARNLCHDLRLLFSSVKLNLSPGPLANTNGLDSLAIVELLLLGVSWARGCTARSGPGSLTTTVSIHLCALPKHCCMPWATAQHS